MVDVRFEHLDIETKNDSEAARTPQWQQAMSKELPVLQKTSFITLSENPNTIPFLHSTPVGESHSLWRKVQATQRLGKLQKVYDVETLGPFTALLLRRKFETITHACFLLLTGLDFRRFYH
ncbi:hypothetical protein Pyn_31847 [Prunus yedoensis var. nudiflora]|uniref:Uncharacterized protein n=1 Tax=Prunus yedoensis var. nudiflora TaxID=2094558 RepID=A0A314Y904_PRUYE|nr:hypothetical protein Pyn_31847 [Prunus yedoensis var. nudiflora]